MTERNFCTESGCPGLCCQNMYLELTKFERTRLFPHAVRVNTIKELLELRNGNIPGVFYTRFRRSYLRQSGFIIASLIGPCPNRAPDGSCTKHEEREHAARNFIIGCTDCNEIRASHGLAPIGVKMVPNDIS